MKKLFVLLVIVLLARVPLAEWQKVPDQMKFLAQLHQVFCEKEKCRKAKVSAVKIKEEVFFFFDCVEKPQEIKL